MKIIVDNFFTILLIMNILLSFIIVFRERKETAQTWAWLLVLMFIPVVGFILSSSAYWTSRCETIDLYAHGI